jgi:hypothetical protein
MNTKAITYWYIIIGLIFIIAGIGIAILSSSGTLEQYINTETLPALNISIVGYIIAVILILIGILILAFGSKR